MIARTRLFAVTGAVSLLAGCASAPPQASTPAPKTSSIVQQPSETPAHVVEGDGTESDRTTIQNSDSQIYRAEHAIDPDAANVSNAQNQGIP